MTAVRLIAVTRPLDPTLSPQGLVEYCARVSSPERQDAPPQPGRLLAYLMREGHWSPLEMVHAVVEVECPRDIGRQLLRHRSFAFQEHSQRYERAPGFALRGARRQGSTNRQSSTDDLTEDVRVWWAEAQADLLGRAADLYADALDRGVARECARVILPEGLTLSRLYMAGSLRSWVHYLAVREAEGTQAEHREVARAIRAALAAEFPLLGEDGR